jgi:hypothetical protein
MLPRGWRSRGPGCEERCERDATWGIPTTGNKSVLSSVYCFVRMRWTPPRAYQGRPLPRTLVGPDHLAASVQKAPPSSYELAASCWPRRRTPARGRATATSRAPIPLGDSKATCTSSRVDAARMLIPLGNLLIMRCPESSDNAPASCKPRTRGCLAGTSLRSRSSA